MCVYIIYIYRFIDIDIDTDIDIDQNQDTAHFSWATYEAFLKWRYPFIAGWFLLRKMPPKMDDLRVPPFQETPIPIGSMYAINMGTLTINKNPNVSINLPYMDPMGMT